MLNVDYIRRGVGTAYDQILNSTSIIISTNKQNLRKMTTLNPPTVTISLDANGKLVVKPDTVPVNPGDTVIWTLAPGLSWPNGFTPSAIISYLHKEGYAILVYPDTLAFGDPVPPSTKQTIRGQVRQDAPSGGEQFYNVNASREGNEDEILSTHNDDDIDSIDPKIKMNPTM